MWSSQSTTAALLIAFAGCGGGNSVPISGLQSGGGGDLAMLSGTGPLGDTARPDLGARDADASSQSPMDAATTADSAVSPNPPDSSAPADMGMSAAKDAATATDMASTPVNPPPVTLQGVTVLGQGVDFTDASSDQGGNVWGVTSARVYFYRAGTGSALLFDQSSGLAQGKTTWIDPYWFGTPDNPSTQPVSFSAVAGGMAGEAFIGNIGYSGDRFQIDPANGAVVSVVGLAVTDLQQKDPDERLAQQRREVATWHAVVDLNGTFGGTAYFGGFHGTGALHGLTASRTSSVCGCTDYEEHIHAFSAGGDDVYGGDVHALFVTNEGDLWMGDRKALYFTPQGSLGANADFFQSIGVPGHPEETAIDVFPDVDDWNFGVAVDGSGGLYVASHGNGLAYLTPGTYAATYFNAGNVLPTNYLTGLDIDQNGEVWIATESSGVLRYSPSSGSFTRYTTAQGLPSNDIRQVHVDRYRAGRAVYFATDNGIAVYTGP